MVILYTNWKLMTLFVSLNDFMSSKSHISLEVLHCMACVIIYKINEILRLLTSHDLNNFWIDFVTNESIFTSQNELNKIPFFFLFPIFIGILFSIDWIATNKNASEMFKKNLNSFFQICTFIQIWTFILLKYVIE